MLTSLTSGFCAILAILFWLSTSDSSHTQSDTSRLEASFHPSGTAVHPEVHDSANTRSNDQQRGIPGQVHEMMQGQSGPAACDQPVGWQKQTKPQFVKFM